TAGDQVSHTLHEWVDRIIRRHALYAQIPDLLPLFQGLASNIHKRRKHRLLVRPHPPQYIDDHRIAVRDQTPPQNTLHLNGIHPIPIELEHRVLAA
ncbi:hypothetical protein COL922a_014752, partial [Colletotrichum nupharicola]